MVVTGADLPLAYTELSMGWWETEGVAAGRGEAKQNKRGVPHLFDSRGFSGGLSNGGGGDWGP